MGEHWRHGDRRDEELPRHFSGRGGRLHDGVVTSLVADLLGVLAIAVLVLAAGAILTVVALRIWL